MLHVPQRVAPIWRYGVGFLAAGGFCLALLLLLPGIAFAQSSTEPIIRPATRELRQLLNRARKALDEQDYPAAVQALEELLTDPTLDDYFLAPPGGEESQVSVKAMGNQLLGTLPTAARQLYETQVGHEARRRLNEALAARDVAAVSEVARRYVHTKAGYEATFLLGRIEIDQGRALAAAILLQPLCEQAPARELLDPELSILTAAAWHHARRPEKAVEVLIALKWRTPRVKVRLQDGEEPLFEREEDALKWLERVAGRGLAPAASIANQWVMFRGDEARNAASVGGLPLVNSEWFFPSINDPKLEPRLAMATRAKLDKGETTIPAVQALTISPPARGGSKAVDYVVIRTPEKVTGVSLKTGKRLWVYPWNDPPTEGPGKLAQGTQQAIASREALLRQRLWDDNLYNQMSSDGEQLYFVDDLEYMNTLNNTQLRAVWIGAQRGLSKSSNLLTSLNLRRQGTLCWTVGGDSGTDDPNLAGAFFLGAPVTIAEKLYILAEFNGEIRLLCLNPENGSLLWKQQLGSVPDESYTVRIDSTRRLAAASASFADGLLICPTSAGAVVAVDLGTRALKWNYTYDRNDVDFRNRPRIFSPSVANSAAPSERWLDSTAVIADGSVIVTPVESSSLHCLDLVTGKPRWEPLKRGEDLFVACVHRGKIVLVGKRSMRAVNVSDGKEAWTAPLDFGGETASGRGFYNGSRYYLPITGQQLLEVDLEAGKVVTRSRTEFTLGNLVSFAGEVVSVGHDQIAAFYQVDHVQAQVDKALAVNPNDVQALARLGELLLTKNETTEAVTILRRAYKSQPDDARIQGLLARVILLLLRTDFANHHNLIPEAHELIKDRAQRRELLRLQAVGMHKAGLVAESLEAFVTLADELQTELGPDDNSNAQMEYIDNKWQVRTSRWLQARLTELYANSQDAERAKLQERLEARLGICLKTNSLSSARRFVELYGFHPLADRARLLLVQKLLTEKLLLEAELRAGELTESADPNYRAAGLAALVECYDLAQRPYLAAERFGELSAWLAENPLDPKHAAASGVTKLITGEVVRKQLVLDQWSGGKVQKTEGNLDGNRARPYLSNVSAVTISEFSGPAPRGMRAIFDAPQQAIQVFDSLGRNVSTAPLRRSDGVYRSYSSLYSGLQARAAGHVILIHTGNEVLAVDALRSNRGAGDPVLWRADVVAVDPLVSGRSYSTRAITNPITGNRTVSYDSSGQTNYQPGPVTPFGAVFQRSRQLVCADPVTGETLWERSGIELASELFGDEEYVFVVPQNSDEATVYSMRDGALLGTRTVGRSHTRIATKGRRILSWGQIGSTLQVRLIDAWNDKAPLWQLETAPGAKGQVLEGREFAILESTGKFTVISLTTGQLVVQSQLQPEPILNSLQVFRSLDQFTVLANTPVADPIAGLSVQALSGSGPAGQLAHGRVYAIDAVTGKQRWQTPAFIGQHALPFDQPVDSPLLIFARNRRPGNNSYAAEILCLDKRTGAIAYEGVVANGQGTMCEVQADLEKQVVQVTTWVQPGTARVTLLKLTNEPQPPQPPAQTGQLSSLTVGQPPGTSVNVSDGLFDPNGRRPGANGNGPGNGPGGNVPVPAPAPADPFGAAPAPGPRPAFGRQLPPNLPPAIAEQIKELERIRAAQGR